MQKKIIQELKIHLPLLPLTIYNLKKIKIKSNQFSKIKTKENKLFHTVHEVVESLHKSTSKIL